MTLPSQPNPGESRAGSGKWEVGSGSAQAELSYAVMLLERYYDDALAQASYLIGCEACGEAIVVDPNRDIDRYVRAAAARKLRITSVTETHIHADFLSGSRELAAATKATLLLSAHGGESWSYGFTEGVRLVRDGDSIAIGNVRLDVRHTPGHTPEHIAFIVTDADAPRIVYPAAIMARSARQTESAVFLRCLQSRAVAGIFRKYRFTPLPEPGSQAR